MEATARPSSPLSYILLTLAGAIALAVACIYLMSESNDDTPFFLIAGCLLAFPLFVAMLRGSLDLAEPIWLFITMAFFSFYARPYGLLRGGIHTYMGQYLSFASPSGFRGALGLVVLGLFFILLGYYLPIWRGRPTAAEEPKPGRVFIPRRMHLVMVAACAFSGLLLAFVLWVLPVPLGEAVADRVNVFQGMGYLVLGVRLSALVCLAGVVVARLQNWQTGRRLRLLMLGISVPLPTLLGSRAPFATALIVLVIVYYYFGHMRHKNLVLAIIGVMGLFVINLMADVRGTGGRLDARMVTDVLDSVSVENWGGTLYLARRSPEFDSLTLLQDRWNEMPLQYGKTYAALLTAPIPARFWPSKPKTCAYIFNEYFLGESFLAGAGGIRPSILGEFYMNFGYVGVVVGMWFFGTLLRRGHDAFVRKRAAAASNPVWILCYVILVSHIPQLVRGEFVIVAVSAVFSLIVVLVTVRLTSRKAPVTAP